MPAIITNAFRTYNADNFISAFATNKMYLMIGKADSWSGADLGQYSESSPSDTAVNSVVTPEARGPELESFPGWETRKAS